MSSNLTIVIPSHNNLDYLKLCYASIRAASKQVKLIIIDDGSVDGTYEWLTTLAEPNTFFISDSVRWGHTIWYDIGFHIAKTDYIGIMHSDMIVAPNFFEVLEPYLNTTDVVSAKCIEPPLHPAGREKIIKDFGMYPNDFKLVEFVNFAEAESEKMNGKTAPALFAPWFIHKEKYNELIGGHDKQFAPYGWEDADIFVRMMKAGFTPVQVQSLLVYHFTQRGHRWNAGNVGTAHTDYALQMHITRNRFATKWGTLHWKDENHTPNNIPLYYKQLTIKNYSQSTESRVKYEVLNLFFNRVETTEGQVVKTDGSNRKPNYEVVFDYAINYDVPTLVEFFQQIPFMIEQYDEGTYHLSDMIFRIHNTKQL